METLSLNNLSIEQIRLLNTISQEIKIDFNNLVGRLLQDTDQSIDWLVSSTLSRDANLSAIFLDCCYVELTRRIVKENSDINKIIAPSSRLYKTLKLFFNDKPQIEVCCSQRALSKVWFYVRPFVGFFRTLFLSFVMFLSRNTSRADQIPREEPLTLIDTFVLPETLKNNSFVDRYYPGLWDELTDLQKKNVYYVPHIMAFGSYLKQSKTLSSIEGNFIIKSDFLSIKDYIFALFRPFRIKKVKFDNLFLNGVNVSYIFEADFYYNLCCTSSFMALLNYRFIAQLKEQGMKIRVFINWFENQVVDRSFIKALKKFFPETKTIGYQGYVAPQDFYIHIQPTPEEWKAGVIPDYIFVMGQKLVDHIKALEKNLNVGVAPAFRYQNVWKNSVKILKDKKVIFAPLPVRTQESRDIISFLLKIKNHSKFQTYEFFVKFHPASDFTGITKVFSKDDLKFIQFTEQTTEEMLQKATVVISNSSSICLESLTQGIPVIIIGSQSGLTQNPIPHSVGQDFWRLVYTENELFQALEDLLIIDECKSERFGQKAEEIKSDYFEPVTKQRVADFLAL